VLIRSLLAGTTPVVLPPGPFDAPTFAAGVATLVATTDPGVALYTSLVPTQLHRLLATPIGLNALEAFAAVLVGGAPMGVFDTRPSSIVETYGATETAGGCVYNGIPLKGVLVEIDDTGRIRLGGTVIADGYADGDDACFSMRDDTRWFQTSDLGAWEGGSLRVLGRADDVIITGGYKVHPAVVEREILALPHIDQAVVIGLPDPEWGTRLVALVVVKAGAPVSTTPGIREALASELPPFALPREVRVVDSLPLLESGKIDREAARAGA
jgi:O-succinylbenzoic acid--CoA ligase